MEFHTADFYKDEVRNLEEAIAHSSDQVLADQELRFQSTLNEMTQNITSISKENDFLTINSEGNHTGSDALVVEPSSISGRITDLNQFVELLKMTHLEQEALDYFLRYTISSTNMLHLESEGDPKYISLKDEVKELENNTLRTNRDAIDEAKKEIFDKSKELANKQDQINEMYLEATDILDNCWEMINEFEDLQTHNEKRQNESNSKKYASVDNNIIQNTHYEWKLLQETVTLSNNLDNELKQIETTRDDSKKRSSTQKSKGNNINQKTNDVGSTLTRLIKLWEKRFLPTNGLHPINLEVYPQTKKFQFNASDRYTVIIDLNPNGKAVANLHIYENNGKILTENPKVREKLLSKYSKPFSNYEVYQIMEDVLYELH